MTDTLQEYEQKPAGRPMFLTILCILTFIGSGLSFVSAGYTYMTADKQSADMVKQKQEGMSKISSTTTKNEGQKVAANVFKSMEAFTPANLRKVSIGGMIAAVFCLSGAFLMFQLKKNGFYLYIFGTLIGIVSPFVIYGGSNLMAIISSVMVGIIGIAFIVLYGVNLRHMK